jgi:hypothetical protein
MPQYFPKSGSRGTVGKKRTLIDPKTARPVTIRDDELSQLAEAAKIIQKKLVKAQLKQVAKLQQQQQKTIENLEAKHKTEMVGYSIT